MLCHQPACRNLCFQQIESHECMPNNIRWAFCKINMACHHGFNVVRFIVIQNTQKAMMYEINEKNDFKWMIIRMMFMCGGSRSKWSRRNRISYWRRWDEKSQRNVYFSNLNFKMSVATDPFDRVLWLMIVWWIAGLWLVWVNRWMLWW